MEEGADVAVALLGSGGAGGGGMLQFHQDMVDELLERDGLTVMAEGEPWTLYVPFYPASCSHTPNGTS